VTRTNSEGDRRKADRREGKARANSRFDVERRAVDRRHAHHLRDEPFPEEAVPLAAWLEAMLEHEIAEAR
jgi:hypothetical protein